jgi:hypothetical protein
MVSPRPRTRRSGFSAAPGAVGLCRNEIRDRLPLTREAPSAAGLTEAANTF